MTDISGVTPLLERIKSSKKPVVMYGTGNGADKILRLLSDNGISVSGFFASDGFVRDRYFHSLKVLSLEELTGIYPDPLVLLAFGSDIPEVTKKIKSVASRYELLSPDVPVAGEGYFDMEFYSENAGLFSAARALFEDGLSVRLFDDIIRYKLSGDIAYLCGSGYDASDSTSLLSGGYEVYGDFGAYRGETISEIIGKFPSVKSVYAFEPSDKNLARIQLLSYPRVSVSAICACAGDKDGTAPFSDAGGRGARSLGALSGKSAKYIKRVRFDSVFTERGKKLLLKYDVEGDERPALEGSYEAIRGNRTELVISVYHRREDMFDIPLLIRSVLPESKLYLRRKPSLPAWDIDLIVKTYS